MAMVSEEITSICGHCNRPISSTNIDLHYAHCSRNLEKCEVCGDMVPRKHAEEHYLSTHAPVACSLCSETMDRGVLDAHKGENCPQRIVTCEYCEFPLPVVDLFEHQDVCGNRTEYCHSCGRYIRLCERYVHETTCNSVPDVTLVPSRDTRPPVESEARPPQRRASPTFPRRHMLVTIAVAGIAFIIGSLFLKKKSEEQSCTVGIGRSLQSEAHF